MNLIQVLLLAGTAAILTVYLGFFRSVLRDRLTALFLFAAAVTCILAPDLTTTFANLLGVGRGTDLLVYVFVTAVSFTLILVFSRIAKLERAQTELVRHQALLSARKPK